MADDTDKDSKTEDPTGKRLTDARNKGQVANSKEVSTAFMFLASTGIFYFQGDNLWSDLQEKMRFFFGGFITDDVTTGGFVMLLQDVILGAFLMVAPFFLIFVSMAILASVVQHGFLLSWEPLKPNFSKINPLTGLKRLFSTRSLMELLKSVLKIVLISMAVHWSLMEGFDRMLMLSATSMENVVHTLGRDAIMVMLLVTVLFVLIALIDFLYQKFQYTKGLRMTKQEVKDEQKQMEGDPMVKGRIRQIQREMAQRRMMEEVPKADVVITNPTHFSVALLYKQGEMRAPTLTAKGRGEIAARIRTLAKENGVPLVENPPLARVLFKDVELGGLIPQNLFKAVAEVLAYVYSLRR